MILVTGRIMNELRAVFPDVEDRVGAVVDENGASVGGPAGDRSGRCGRMGLTRVLKAMP